MERLNDVPVTVRVLLGQARLSVKELLNLKPGAVLKLNTAAGEPLTLQANGAHMAKGDVISVNDKLGLRVTDVAHGR